MILTGAMDVKVVSWSPEQMNLNQLRRLPEERVSAVLGVPAILAGLGAGLEAATYNNTRELREFFTEQKLIPLWQTVANEITSQLLQADFDTLKAVDDIGEVIALQLTEYFEQDANLEELARLQKAGLQFDMEVVKAPSEGPLVGAKVVVSGVFESFSRDELKMLIETLGGQNVSSISSKTTYVVAGEGIGPSKKAKAEKLDVPILNEDEFKALIQ